MQPFTSRYNDFDYSLEYQIEQFQLSPKEMYDLDAGEIITIKFIRGGETKLVACEIISKGPRFWIVYLLEEAVVYSIPIGTEIRIDPKCIIR